MWEHITFCAPAVPTRRHMGDVGKLIFLHVEPVDPTKDEPYGSRLLMPLSMHPHTSRGVHALRD